MAESNCLVQDSPESSTSDIFEYTITYRSDGTLQWDPPSKSTDLAVALSYHFPLEESLESKMQAAIKKFLLAEGKKPSRNPSTESSSKWKNGASKSAGLPKLKIASEKPTVEPGSQPERGLDGECSLNPISKVNGSGRRGSDDQSPKNQFHRPVSELQVLSWDPEAHTFKGQRKKRSYGEQEGLVVARNRGFVCDEHRRQKLKCDPNICAQNKRRLANTLQSTRRLPQKHETPQDEAASRIQVPPPSSEEKCIEQVSWRHSHSSEVQKRKSVGLKGNQERQSQSSPQTNLTFLESLEFPNVVNAILSNSDSSASWKGQNNTEVGVSTSLNDEQRQDRGISELFNPSFSPIALDSMLGFSFDENYFDWTDTDFAVESDAFSENQVLSVGKDLIPAFTPPRPSSKGPISGRIEKPFDAGKISENSPPKRHYGGSGGDQKIWDRVSCVPSVQIDDLNSNFGRMILARSNREVTDDADSLSCAFRRAALAARW